MFFINKCDDETGQKRTGFLLALIVFAVTLVIRLVALFDFIDSPFFLPLGGDRGLYHDVAIAFARGNPIAGVFTFLPLYPYLLARLYMIAGGLVAVGVFQAFLDGFTAILLFGAADRRYGKNAGLLAGLGFAFMKLPATYSLVSMPVSLGLFWVVFFVTIFDAWRGCFNLRRSAALGFILGIGGQILGSFWLAIIPFGVYVAVFGTRKRWFARLAAGCLVVVCGYACVLPTLLYNHRKSGELVAVTAHGGLNLFIGNNPAAKGYAVALSGARTSAEEMTRDFQVIASRSVGAPLTMAQADRFWRNAAISFWREQPGSALVLAANKAVRLFSVRDFDDTGLSRLLPEVVPVLRIAFVDFGIIWILAWAGLPWRKLRLSNLASWIIGGCFAVGIMMTFVSARYRLPIAVLLLPPAAGSVTSISSFLRQITRERFKYFVPRSVTGSVWIKILVALLAIAVSIVPHPLPDIRLPDDLNRSALWLRHGDTEKALLYARRAVSVFSESAEAWFALGNALFSNDALSLASDAYAKALKLAPFRVDVMFNLATTLAALDKTDDARSMYELVIASEPQHLKAWFGLAVLMYDSGDERGARSAIEMAASIVGWAHPEISAFMLRLDENSR